MSAQAMDATDIISWLKNNPDFLQENPEAAGYLVPHQAGGEKNVMDFNHFLVKKLQADKESVLATTRDLVEISRANMGSVTRMHEAVLALLEAESFDGFILAITQDLSHILDTDVSVLIVEGNGQTIPNMINSGIRVVPDGTVAQIMGGETALLKSDIHGSEQIFGGGAGLVRSEALMRVDISQKTPPAILAFGSRDPEMFSDAQGTELIGFLARVVERCFRQWLALQA